MASAPNINTAIQINPFIKKKKKPAHPNRLNHTIIPLRCLCGTGHSSGLSVDICSACFINGCNWMQV